MGTTTIVDVVVPEIENGDEYADERKRVLAFWVFIVISILYVRHSISHCTC